MTLFEKLQEAKGEEDVKDIYIKALGLKGYHKTLIDILTDEIWFEAKHGKHSPYGMFTQLLHYVQRALNNGEYVPPFLAVVDSEKAAIMRTADAIPFLQQKTIKWGKKASGYTQEALDTVSAYIGTHLISFKIETQEAEFIETFKNAIGTGEIIRIQITPNNLKQVFDKWVPMIGREIESVSEEDYALLFFADVMSSGTVATHDLPAVLIQMNGSPAFILRGAPHELGNEEGYRQFWAIYDRPPEEKYRDYLLERRDSLIPLDERSFKGAYYTPLNVVDKAYDKLAETLGKNWQKDYIVWDMCCGVGNLEVKHSNPRNVYMSTLDQADVDVMRATKTCGAATRFQYDYLNDDITDNGEIDYSRTNKIPQKLRDAIAAGKKILVLMNPPYAESGDTLGSEAKTKVATTKVASNMQNFGHATRELFTQFLSRIANELPIATVAMFGTLKYVNAPNFENFRENWNARFAGGFVVHSKAFDGLDGDFPIGFLIWKTDQHAVIRTAIAEIATEVFSKKVEAIGEKRFYNLPKERSLNAWVKRPRANRTLVVPLKNAIHPADKTIDVRGSKWAIGAIGQMLCDSNDLQHAAQRTAVFSSGYCSPGAFFITAENLWQASIIFMVRRIVKPTWLNDRDQFLQPDKPLSEEFKNDCLIWMLFNGSNLTASANDLEWNGKRWSIVNHFIPYIEAEVGAPDQFESEFMVQYMSGKTFSEEANAVLQEGKKLWRAFFAKKNSHTVRDKLKLNRADVGWYQVRKALQARNASGDFAPVSFEGIDATYKALTEKLRPLVYELGFLKA